ncbi:hypothetical protein Chor_015213 [Crotalus horridus]
MAMKIYQGVVFIPATILLTAPDILYRLQQSKVSCVVANEAIAPLVDAVESECSWLKTRILVSKSSKREGWMNFHDLLQEWLSLTSSDIMWGFSDPGWIKFAIGSFYSPWSQGSCIFQHGMLQFDPKVVLESLVKYPVTGFCGTPTIFRMLLQHNVSRYRFKSLESCTSGGEPISLEVQQQWKAQTGCEIREAYGQTESIIDEKANRLPPGEEGDIAVKIKPQRPVGLFSAYVDDPEKTSATERGDYYLTGDRGLMDEEGYVQFISRADDIILTSGYRIGPFEVEQALMKHPAVAEAAVVSSPDSIRGEVVKAFIILTPAYQSQDREKLSMELQGHVKKITAPYKYPRKVSPCHNRRFSLRSAMKMLFIKGQWLKSIWSRRKLGGLVPQAMKIFTSLDFSEFEAINRGDKEVPKYFNFANDVLDKWSKIEKNRRRSFWLTTPIERHNTRLVGPPQIIFLNMVEESTSIVPFNIVFQNGERAFYPALWWIDGKGGEVKWDFEKLGLVSRKAANVLTGPCGLQRGDRVILILPRIPEWWMLTVACMRAGIVSLPGTPQLTAKDIQYRLQVSKAKGIITNDSLAPLVETISSACPSLQIKLLISERRREGWQHFKELFEAAPSSHNCVQTRSDEPMIIFFTSGTTGSPKMVEHSQTSLPLGLALPGRFWLDFKPSDVMWNMSDTGWVKVSVGSVFGPWLRGTSVFIHSMPQFDPKEVLNTLSKYPVTTMCTAPTAYRMLVQEDLSSYTFKNLSHCLAVGEPMNPEVVSQWKKQTGLQIHEGYGQTEVGMVMANEKGRPVKPGSMGTAFSSYDVQIVDEEGKILPPGQEGDIAIRIKPKRPFSFFSRYVDSPEKNSAVVRGNFYITGDRGWMDEDGYFWFIGRSDDVIISSGYRIGPFEVESALIEHPAVVESAVVVKAFVVLSPEFASYNPEKLACELQDHVKKVTAPYKWNSCRRCPRQSVAKSEGTNYENGNGVKCSSASVLHPVTVCRKIRWQTSSCQGCI